MKISMNKNSIVEVIAENPNSIIAKIQLFLNNPQNERIVVLVEGVDDRKFFSKFFDENTTQIECCDGCKNVVCVFEKLNPRYEEYMIAIKDADYDILEGKTYTYTNFFLTDCHDLEMMILHNSCVENNLCAECSLSTDSGIVKTVLEDIKSLSYLRWYNEKNQKGLELKQILCNLYKGSNALDCETCLCMIEKDKGKGVLNKSDLLSFKSKCSKVDLFDLSVGHDVCYALALKLKYLCRNKGLKCKIHGEEGVSSAIRIAYNASDFKKTELYRSLKKWEEGNCRALLKNSI